MEWLFCGKILEFLFELKHMKGYVDEARVAAQDISEGQGVFLRQWRVSRGILSNVRFGDVHMT